MTISLDDVSATCAAMGTSVEVAGQNLASSLRALGQAVRKVQYRLMRAVRPMFAGNPPGARGYRASRARRRVRVPGGRVVRRVMP